MKALRSNKIEAVEVETSEFDGAMTAADVVDMATGELMYEANQELSADKLHKISSPASPASRSSSPSATTSATSSPTRCGATPCASPKRR